MDTVVYIISYIMYLCLCVIAGIVCARANISTRDWKLWAIILCVVGSYICGYLRGGL